MSGFSNSMFGQAAKQVGGLAKHALGKMVAEPMEVLSNAVGSNKGQQGQENQAMEAMEQGAAASNPTQSGSDPNQPKGFKTVQDYQKYQQLSGNKDQLEIAMIRRKLQQEWGLDAGMQKASAEWEQKEQQRKQVEEREEEEKKYVEFEKKKADNAQVAMAKNAASAEKRMSVAG